MVDFVEKATLVVNDRASGNINKINRNLRTLLATVRNLRSVRANVNVRGPNASQVQRLERLGRALKNLRAERDVKVRVTVTGATAAQTKRVNELANALGRLNRATANVRPVNLPNLPPARIPPTGPRVPGFDNRNPGGTTATGIQRGLRQAFNPVQVGRDIGRGFVFSMQGEAFQIGREIARTVAASPANLDDARSRVRVAGRSAEELNVIEGIASSLSRQFQTVTEAEIIANSGEVTGRFGDLTLPENMAQAEAAMTRLAKNAMVLQAALSTTGAEAAKQARLVETAIQQTGNTGDPVLAERISQAVLKAVIASGGDLTPADVKRALQQSPTSRAGLGDATLTQILLQRDEGGRRSTGNFDQMFSDMVRGNLNAKDLSTQFEAGIRNADGSSDVLAALQTNFLAGVQSEIIPRLQELGVETDFTKFDKGSEEFAKASTILRAAIDNDLGFSKQGGITTLADAIINLPEALREFNRAEKADPQFAVNNPTVRQELGAVRSQFENVASAALEPLLPAVKAGLDGLSDTLNAVQQGDGLGLAQLTALGTGVAPIAIGAGLEAMMSAETRALGAAGLALSGSAVALTGAATALTGAAGVQAVTGVADGLGGGDTSSRKGRGAPNFGFRNLFKGVGIATIAPVAVGAIASALLPDRSKELDKATAEEGPDATQADLIANIAGQIAAEQEPKEVTIPELTGLREQNQQALDAVNAEIQTLTAEMQRNAENPNRLGALTQDQQNQTRLAELQDEQSILQTVVDNASVVTQDLGTVFESGGQRIADAANQFGPVAGEGILAVAGPFGAAVGAAVQAAVGNLNVNVNQTTRGPDTGRQVPGT